MTQIADLPKGSSQRGPKQGGASKRDIVTRSPLRVSSVTESTSAIGTVAASGARGVRSRGPGFARTYQWSA